MPLARPLLTTEDVADLLALPLGTVRRMRRRGDLVGVNVGTAGRAIWRYEQDEVERFVASRRSRRAPTTDNVVDVVGQPGLEPGTDGL